MDKTPSRSHNRLLVFISGCVLTLLTAGVSCAQSITDGATPLGVSPGAPAGAFALSDLDSVNLYNGNLAFRLPMNKIAGRGGAGYTMVVRLEHKWTVERDQEPGVPTTFQIRIGGTPTDSMCSIVWAGWRCGRESAEISLWPAAITFIEKLCRV